MRFGKHIKISVTSLMLHQAMWRAQKKISTIPIYKAYNSVSA